MFDKATYSSEYSQVSGRWTISFHLNHKKVCNFIYLFINAVQFQYLQGS